MGHPTLLAQLAAERHWTPSDAVREFAATAKAMNAGNYSVSSRTWERWCAGQIKGRPRSLAARVLEAMFQRSIHELFAPPPIMTAVGLPTGRPEGAYWSEDRQMPGSGMGSTFLDKEIAAVADDSARFARRVRRIDERALDQFDADVRQLAVDYLRRPPFLTFRRIADLRGEVFAILDEARHPLDQERRLYDVAGRLCALLAHASADLGRPHEAETHVRTALICAELTGDDNLRAYACWVQSNVAYWRGDYRSAADIAHTARRFAASGTTLLRLTSQEARALAAANDTGAFQQAINAARTAREQVLETDETGVFRFSPGKAAYYASEAYLALGSAQNSSHDLRRAQEEAHESLQLLAADPEEQGAELHAAATLDLAAAQLAASELDGAEDTLHTILSLAPEHRTVPLIRRLHGIDERLSLHASTTTALDLREQIALFVTHPAATPELPG